MGLTAKEMSEHLGCSIHKVKYYMKKLGIKTQLAQKYDSYVSYEQLKTKICRSCKLEKSVFEFRKVVISGKEKPGSYCKACVKQQNYAAKNSIKKQALDYKGNKCQCCGYDKYEGALEFHHLDPKEKDFLISRYGRDATLNDKDLFTELDKCALLCSNCHREVHAGLIKLD
jgi:hypothetical protein